MIRRLGRRNLGSLPCSNRSSWDKNARRQQQCAMLNLGNVGFSRAVDTPTSSNNVAGRSMHYYNHGHYWSEHQAVRNQPVIGSTANNNTLHGAPRTFPQASQQRTEARKARTINYCQKIERDMKALTEQTTARPLSLNEWTEAVRLLKLWFHVREAGDGALHPLILTTHRNLQLQADNPGSRFVLPAQPHALLQQSFALVQRLAQERKPAGSTVVGLHLWVNKRKIISGLMEHWRDVQTTYPGNTTRSNKETQLFSSYQLFDFLQELRQFDPMFGCDKSAWDRLFDRATLDCLNRSEKEPSLHDNDKEIERMVATLEQQADEVQQGLSVEDKLWRGFDSDRFAVNPRWLYGRWLWLVEKQARNSETQQPSINQKSETLNRMRRIVQRQWSHALKFPPVMQPALQPNEKVYVVLFLEWLRQPQPGMELELFGDMIDNGLVPTLRTYSLLLNGWAAQAKDASSATSLSTIQQRWKQMEETLARAKTQAAARGLNDTVYRLYLNTLFQNRAPGGGKLLAGELVQHVHQSMKDHDVAPSRDTYVAFLHVVGVVIDRGRLERGELAEKMRGDSAGAVQTIDRRLARMETFMEELIVLGHDQFVQNSRDGQRWWNRYLLTIPPRKEQRSGYLSFLRSQIHRGAGPCTKAFARCLWLLQDKQNFPTVMSVTIQRIQAILETMVELNLVPMSSCYRYAIYAFMSVGALTLDSERQRRYQTGDDLRLIQAFTWILSHMMSTPGANPPTARMLQEILSFCQMHYADSPVILAEVETTLKKMGQNLGYSNEAAAEDTQGTKIDSSNEEAPNNALAVGQNMGYSPEQVSTSPGEDTHGTEIDSSDEEEPTNDPADSEFDSSNEEEPTNAPVNSTKDDKQGTSID